MDNKNQSKEFFSSNQLEEILKTLDQLEDKENEIDFSKATEAWNQVEKMKLFGKQ